MSRDARKSRPQRLAIEALEDRRLMSTVTWGTSAKLIGQDVAANNFPTITGAGASIAILDSGINYNDPALGGGFGAGHKVVAGYDFVDNDGDPMDSDGHGTGVASVIGAAQYTFNGATYQGVAPGANLIALRTDTGGYGWAKEAPLAELALQWVIDHRVEYNIVAVNMSFGKGHYTSPTTLAPISDELATLNSLGVLIVASSGNDGVTVPYGIEYPAADPNVYAVGSVNASDVISTFTERGPDMDILAPGENVPLIYFLPQTGTRAILAGSGTSFATPFVAGMAALLRQVDPTLTPAEMMTIMQEGGSANFDGDHEAAPYTGLTWQRLSVSGAIARAYVVRDDASENNDATASATVMPFVGDEASLAGLKLLKGDADFYKFTLGIQADIDYALTQTGGGAAPSIDLLDANGTLLKHLSAVEQIRLGAGTYYLRVNAPSGTMAGTYGLSVVRTPDDGLNNHTAQAATPIALDGGGDGALGGLNLLGGSDDYFSFTLDATHDVELSVDYAGASAMPAAQLLDTNGNFIANFAGGALARRLGAGRYLIRVYSATTLDGSYGVDVAGTAFVMPGANGSSNGVAYDAAGTLHLAYYDEAAKNLKYATRDAAGVWGNSSVVDPALMAGQFVSLVLDSGGRPGVAYYEANHADLKYAHFNGSSWDVATVDAALTTGYYPSLRFDAADRPVISYYYKTGGDLKFAFFRAGAWNLGTIDSAGDVGRYSSLAANPLTGRWSVAYEDTGHGSFKYADQTKNGWNAVTVDSSTKIAGGYVSLVFNPKTSRPQFSYYDAYNGNLKLASYNGSAWSNQTVTAKGTVGLYSNLRIDAATGDADILYYNKSTDSLFRAKFGAGVWNLTQLASDGGRWVSRAFSAGGVESLAYLKAGDVAVIDL